MLARKKPKKTCWSILANCLSHCSPAALLLLTAAGIATLLYNQYTSNGMRIGA